MISNGPGLRIGHSQYGMLAGLYLQNDPVLAAVPDCNVIRLNAGSIRKLNPQTMRSFNDSERGDKRTIFNEKTSASPPSLSFFVCSFSKHAFPTTPTQTFTLIGVYFL